MAATSSMVPKKFGRLDQHAGGIVVDRFLQGLQIDAAILHVADRSTIGMPW